MYEAIPHYSKSPRIGYHSDKILTNILEDGAVDVRNLDFRIYFQVEKKIRGYFKITAFKQDGNGFELRFWSDNWVEEELPGKKGHQGWEYYPKFAQR